MLKVTRLAIKNLLRYKRRSLLTGLLIAFGVVAVIVFVGLSGSFKRAVVGQVTDSVLSHFQVHKKGYMSSIDNLPLDRSLPAKAYKKLAGILKENPEVEAFSPRIKFGGMLSNYAQTTNVRLNGIDPAKEQAAAPLLKSRVQNPLNKDVLLKKGEVLLPEMLAKGMQIKPGDTVVLVANNKDGSVNGITLKVAGLMESLMGPGGRDGYLHINDAAALLRMGKNPEISEVAVRLKNFENLDQVAGGLKKELGAMKNKKGKPMFELHTWAQLTPFTNIVRMIDIMNLGIKFILIAVVLISVLNVMMMSVYERVREIGALAAMGTKPARIRGLFVAEGCCLGLVSSIAGAVIGVSSLMIMNFTGVEVTFGRNQVFTLAPSIATPEVISACVIVLAVSVLASLQPAAKAARLEPVEALRHV